MFFLLREDQFQKSIQCKPIYKNYQLKFSSVRYLGATSDEALNYDKHRFEIGNNIAKNISIIYKLRSVLPEKLSFCWYT